MSLPIFPFDNFVYWDKYSLDDNIFSGFSLIDLHKIVHDIDDENSWEKFLDEYQEYYKCYVLHRKPDSKALAFIYIINEDLKWNTITIHGGALKGCSVLERYRGYILMLESLLDAGVKVRTTFSNENLNASRFNKSIGFVKYCEFSGVTYAWINRRRLVSTAIYKRLHKQLDVVSNHK